MEKCCGSRANKPLFGLCLDEGAGPRPIGRPDRTSGRLTPVPPSAAEDLNMARDKLEGMKLDQGQLDRMAAMDPTLFDMHPPGSPRDKRLPGAGVPAVVEHGFQMQSELADIKLEIASQKEEVKLITRVWEVLDDLKREMKAQKEEMKLLARAWEVQEKRVAVLPESSEEFVSKTALRVLEIKVNALCASSEDLVSKKACEVLEKKVASLAESIKDLASKRTSDAARIDDLQLSLDKLGESGLPAKRSSRSSDSSENDPTKYGLMTALGDGTSSVHLEHHGRLVRVESHVEDTNEWKSKVEAHMEEMKAHTAAAKLIMNFNQAKEEQPNDVEQGDPEEEAQGRTSTAEEHRQREDQAWKSAYMTIFAEVDSLHWTHPFEASVYEAVFLFGLPFVSGFQSMLIVVGFLCNAFFIVLTLFFLNSDDFQKTNFDKPDRLVHWRQSDAHAYFNADPLTAETLAERVCMVDKALSLATIQRDIVENVDDYLRPVWEGGVMQGRVLCEIAVGLWVFCCILEMRKCLNFLAAVTMMATADRSKVDTDGDLWGFTRLTHARRLLGSFSAMLRLIFAILLAIYGSFWLASTDEIEDLLLNASAMAFVLDIDNSIFACFMSQRIIGLVDSMKPAALPDNKLFGCIPILLAFFWLGFVTYVDLQYIEKMVDMMNLARHILCAPEDTQSLVLGTNALGWVTYSENNIKASKWTSSDMLPSEQVASVIINMTGEPQEYAYKMPSLVSVMQEASMSIALFANQHSCYDSNTLKDANSDTVWPLGNRLWVLTGNESLKTYTTCSTAKVLCFEPDLLGINVRFMCPESCGCAEPLGGLWDQAEPASGCPHESCGKKIRTALSDPSFKCIDSDLTHPHHRVSWNRMIGRMSKLGDITPELHTNLSTLGCDAFHHMSHGEIVDLCSANDYTLKSGAAPFCPQACGCAKSDCDGICPESCCAD